jgi:hypothetical protein
MQILFTLVYVGTYILYDTNRAWDVDALSCGGLLFRLCTYIFSKISQH